MDELTSEHWAFDVVTGIHHHHSLVPGIGPLSATSVSKPRLSLFVLPGLVISLVLPQQVLYDYPLARNQSSWPLSSPLSRQGQKYCLFTSSLYLGIPPFLSVAAGSDRSLLTTRLQFFVCCSV